MRWALAAGLGLVVALLVGCPPQLALLRAPAAVTGGSCTGNWDCSTENDCVCGLCQPRGTLGTCGGLDASVPVTGCTGTQPICFAQCGTFTPASPSLAECDGTRWRCAAGVQLEDCPTDICWGTPRPGEVCIRGAYQCQYGEARPGLCFTPGGCATPDGGAAVVSGCAYSPDCVGAVDGCRNTWCRSGSLRPSQCVANRWQCAQGVEVDLCNATDCSGPPPNCYASCGDSTVVAVASCTGGAFLCGRGVLRADCPSETCWGVRPAGAVACVNGAWICSEAGPAVTGGCLTPNACLGEAPSCFDDVCCQQAATPAVCVDLAWSCDGQNSSAQCATRPFCPVPDAGVPTDAGAHDGGQDGIPMGTSTPACGSDPEEPNNNVAQLTPLLPRTVGSFPSSPMVTCAGDVDLYAFSAQEGATLTAVVEHETANPVTVRLYAFDGHYLGTAATFGSVGIHTVLQVQAVVTMGSYVVAVTSDQARAAPYTLTVTAP